MTKAVIVDFVRTPMGKSKNGVFRNIRADKLSAHLIKALMERNPEVNSLDIEDVVWGCVQQTLEQGANLAKIVALQAGLPVEVTGTTVNRLCGSSMDALHIAARQIKAGEGDVFIVGGVEHMGHVPMTHGVDLSGPSDFVMAQASAAMGLTAEALAKLNHISRQEQDELGVRSHKLSLEAQNKGYFKDQIVPTPGHDEMGTPIMVDKDEVIREDATIESFSKLRPCFDPSPAGTVTPATSSALSDGASALLVMSEEKAKSLGLAIRAEIVSMATAGVPAAIMGIGPVPASEKALKRAGLTLNDIDKFELNEAFGAQAISCIRKMELTNRMDDINMHGGAIALGHPLGCSGSRIVGSVINVLETHGGEYGLATMCIGFGQGIATVVKKYKN
ncbi:acetyl-CoA C-acyltransferase FadA [Aliivibrio sifiae]|uniref:acetyl-CoA C-acyltransferase n=1 Tax=Aliivibrio sifiae TaxID=566293 RepID=A0A2S7X8B7_9GAMM|nr:acetyl-CoA C-acyltransferase FadA [Aliivibrio sifiae]PQJ87613.1 acetyl-CoA C-acyltransferase FadA [Aliivibrio sifiae]GLR73226.1 3-ketoacyl-CoA thiolase [Aliivibrio sifiae]